MSGGLAQGVPAGTKICHRSHVSGNKWMEWNRDGQFSGTVGENRAIEADRQQGRCREVPLLRTSV
ncbi:hypothetical protein ABT236_19475 [Streptomyces sp. NPDC001523]|uniref:hypothetical protein n=1 Tax=Streptomyces sp. NPDC001523 TaxID=3154383 RepID=UPI0033309544